MPKGIEIKTDFRSVYNALPVYAHFRNITLVDALKDRAGKLAFRLYKAYRKFAPSLATMRAIPLKIIKPRKGRTKRREKAVRISARFYTATGWLAAAARYGKGLNTLVNARKLNGGAIENLTGLRPTIEIFNSTEGSVILDQKHNVIQAEIIADSADMLVYIQRKADEATMKFNSHR